MGVILDTSVIIALERESISPSAVMQDRENETFGLSVVTVSELLHGVHRATPVARRIKREAFVERIISEFTLYPFDVGAARIYAQIWAELASKAIQIGAHNLLIAATAISLGHEVLTVNERDFMRIKGLHYSKI
ncbi:MAG TPA: type II toxin-antitoxin system VapC family toxin [Pyrinomonadaceae bacterium]|nr:type II toxin-antitoxin system VapC family toxin [Pyrinomonadaceae bacterium]